MTGGRLAVAGGVGLGAVWLIRRSVRRGAQPVAAAIMPELAAWERASLAQDPVGLPEGHDPDGVDVTPVGDGSPDAYCFSLGAAGPLGAEPAGSCVVDPLDDPRFAPVDRGTPFVDSPTSSAWPVLSKHPSRLVVSYWTAEGVRGYSGRAFAAKRGDEKGHRKHAGVDLFGREGDVVVAPETGRVLAILPFNAGDLGRVHPVRARCSGGEPRRG